MREESLALGVMEAPRVWVLAGDALSGLQWLQGVAVVGGISDGKAITLPGDTARLVPARAGPGLLNLQPGRIRG